jgi:hypothetical protein
MSHIVEKLLMKATIFKKESPQWEVCIRNYELQSDENNNFGNFDLRLLGKMTCGCNPMANHRKYYKREGGDFP